MKRGLEKWKKTNLKMDGILGLRLLSVYGVHLDARHKWHNTEFNTDAGILSYIHYKYGQ